MTIETHTATNRHVDANRTKPMSPTRLAFTAIGITWAIVAIYNLLRITPRALTTDHRLVVSQVHQKHGWVPPVSVELRNGVIEVDYNCEGSALPPRTVTRERLEYIRAVLKPYFFDDYRVSCIGRPGFAEYGYGASTVTGDGPIEWNAKDDSGSAPKQSR